MHYIETLQEVLKKYHLFNPIPLALQKELFRAKKETLRAILTHKNEYSFFVNSILIFLYLMKNLGFDFSYRTSRAFVGIASFAASFSILLGIFFIARPLFFIEIPNDAVVICRVGDVTVNHSGKNTILLNVRDIVDKGDVITTGKKSFAIVQIGDNEMLRIQPESKVAVSSILKSEHKEFFLSVGTIISRLKKFEGNGSFTIKTPTTVASVRGTAFSVSYNNTQCIVSVKEGIIHVMHIPRQKEYLLYAGNTLAIAEDSTKRPTTETEKLEIKRLDATPYQEKTKTMNESEEKVLLEFVLHNDEEIDGEIQKLNDASFPQTLQEIRQKYGRIDVIQLFNGQKIRGAIISRGATWKMVIPKKYTYIPAVKVRNTTIE